MKLDFNKIDILMAKKQLTAQQLADLTNISRVAINKYRNGTREPVPIIVGKMAKGLKVNVEDIILKED